MKNKLYDIIIIGGGPAGYTSALYGARAGFSTLLMEKFSAGGQMTQTQQIDNYPGFPDGIDGFSLGENMKQSAEKYGAETLQAEVISADLKAEPKIIKTDSGDFSAKAVIIATGAVHKHLGIEKEEQLVGKGVGYCASCDGMFFRNKTVAVIGGGNSAINDALLLSRICKKVYLIHRRDSLRGEKIHQDALMSADNVEFLWNTQAKELIADDKLQAVKLIDNNGKESEIEVDGLFISIGRSPETTLVKGQLDLDKNGYIIADETTKTNIEGVFAAGDVRTKAVRQIVTATADGATAIHFAQEYINS